MSVNLLDVEYPVYKNRNIVPGSYYHKCVKEDLISIIGPLLQKMGYHLNYEGLYRRLAIAVGSDTPWHHVKHLRTKKCGLDHSLKFYHFNYVPPRCMECWKVVVSPRTLKELFLLLEVEKSLERPSKCGIEIRYYTPRLYGGYFYSNSLDEGRECYSAVRRAVDEHISPDVPIILKRACTEYEMILGPSVGWHSTKEQQEIDARIENMIDTYTPATTGQTPECLAQVHTSWIEWAWKYQDPTVEEYLGGMPLYPETMTFHEGNLEQIKMDMCRAKAKVKHNIDPEVVDAVHSALRGFDMTKRVSLPKIGAILGFEQMNPLFTGEGANYE